MSTITLRDYQHARNIFTPRNNSFLPKSKNWFHIFFELDPVAKSAINSSLSSPTSSYRLNWNPSNIPILGVLAKTVKLPNFKFDVKKSNQYNRWSLNTTKINYDPLEISFWDDTVDIIRTFWYAYYQYMNQDVNYTNWNQSQNQGVQIPTAWQPTTANNSSVYTTSENWNNFYGLDTVNTSSAINTINRTNPFFRSIRVYQFNRVTDTSTGVKYSEYVLVNPLITSFEHDTADFSSSDFMQNRMTIEFETVLYNAGLLNSNEIASWDSVLSQFFDTTQSPNASYELLSTQITSTIQSGINSVQENSTTTSAAPTVTTTLNSTNGTSSELNNTALSLENSTSLAVPFVVSGYGTSGSAPGV